MGFDNGSRGRAKHQIFKAFLFNDLVFNGFGCGVFVRGRVTMRSAAGGRGQQPAVRNQRRQPSILEPSSSGPDSRAVPVHQRGARTHLMSRSRTFLRNVFRLSPKSSAALIWLPRVAASAAVINGCSISRRIL
jgi:hypothetical protein